MRIERPLTDIVFTATCTVNRDPKPKKDKKTRLILIADAHYIVACKTIITPLTKELEHRPWQPFGTGLAGRDFAKYRHDFLATVDGQENSQNMMIDYKGYDKSVDAWIIREQYKSIKK